MKRRVFLSSLSTLLVLAFGVTACLPLAGKPSVVIVSPPSGSQFHEGEDVAIQSTSTDATAVVRVELVVDGTTVRTDPSPTAQGQPSLTLIQTWKATQGTHTIMVRAYNAAGAVSDPVAISVTVLQALAVAPTATTAPGVLPPVSPTHPAPPLVSPTAIPPTVPRPAGCTDNSAFVADITVPDGTELAPGQTFNKIWRVSNNGTCPWGPGYQFIFVSGEAMATTTTVAVPATAPGAAADLLVAMTAPTTPGAYTGYWRLRNPSGAVFGAQVSVKVNVISSAPPPSPPPEVAPPTPPPSPPPEVAPPPPPPPPCSGTPNIASFTASPGTITAGGSSTLSWGAVTNAESAEIDQGIGGVETPGSRTVSPATTTTYTLIARCGTNIATRPATVTVDPPPPEVPSAPTGLSATTTGQTTASLTWADNANNEDGFKVYRSISGVDPQVGTVGAHAGTGSMTFNLTGLTCSETYVLYVKSYKGGAESASSNYATVTTDPCTPTSVSAPSHTGQTVTVNWTDNSTTPEETGFRIYFGTTLKKTVGSYAGTGVRSTTVSGLDCGTTYSDIRVSAYYGTRESPKSSSAGNETTSSCQIKVEFTKVDIKNDTDTGFMDPGEIRLTFTVEGSTQYWPSSSGHEDIHSGGSKTFSKVFNVSLRRSQTLNIKIQANDVEDDPDDMGELLVDYPGRLPTNFGAGSKTRENSYFKIYYTITVTAPP